MFLTVLLFAVVIVAVIVYLPYSTGLIKYNYEKKPKKTPKKETPKHREYNGYVPPDEVQEQKPKAFNTGINTNITKDDIPVKVSLTGGNLRKRREKLDVDSNPNNYDYDLDEIINEQEPQEYRETQPSYKESV